MDFAADEIASAFNMTWLSAAGEIDHARTVARRLPVTHPLCRLAVGAVNSGPARWTRTQAIKVPIQYGSSSGS